MKKAYLLTISLIISLHSFGQQCIAGIGQFDIIANNYRARLLSDNDIFWDFTAGVPRFEIPIYSNSFPIFAAAPWMGGYSGGNLHIGAMTYRQYGIDFWPGPIDTLTLNTDITDCQAYDTFFPIRRAEVNNQKNHLYNYANMPANITYWPANPIAGENTSYKLAPYEDVNHNNKYDPLNGDYPIMFGDYSVFQINNDVGNRHGETGGLSMGIETHITNYAITCDNDSALKNTLFLHYDIINRGVDTFTNFLFSMWSSFGYEASFYSNSKSKKNYIGCDTLLNMYYSYKGTGYDIDIGGETGYHQYLPAFAGVFLNQKLSRFISYNNTASTINGNPSYASRGIPYINLMNSFWENGTPMTYGDSGTTVGTNPTKYIYSGDPTANTGWTEANAGNKPGNRNGLGSCGPFTFYPKDTLKIDFAYVFARDYQHPGDSIACIPILRKYVQKIQRYYNTDSLTIMTNACAGVINIPPPGISQLLLYPNPATTSFNLALPSQGGGTYTINIYDMFGRLVMQDNYTPPSEGQLEVIDVSNLSEAIYNISINTPSGVVIKRLVIVR